jgi:hypothetical protein
MNGADINSCRAVARRQAKTDPNHVTFLARRQATALQLRVGSVLNIGFDLLRLQIPPAFQDAAMDVVRSEPVSSA